VIDYEDKVALVTGAASGIGAALAEALASRGAQVICADINEDGLSQTVKHIGGNTQGLACNLADPAAAAKLIDDVYDIAGRLDLVCSNAGVGFASELAKTDFEHKRMNRLFEINFFAGLKLAKAYVQRLEICGERGRLMVTGSENSLSVPSAVRGSRLAAYSATTHALLVAMEWFRIEQEEGPLELHVLMPGAVYTPLIAANLPDPAAAPPELEIIMPEQCAAIALKGMDLGLFYIPTQAHIADDMQPRLLEVAKSLELLGIEKTY
jgi:NAD(P)-dependent dehydrogenase (short-subunit alcohol dehydrogenase family)